MAVTQIADVIVPAVFNPYVIQRTMALSALVESGVAQNTPQFDALASAGARTINMPYWSDLTGASEVLSDSAPLTPAKIAAGQDIATILRRGKAWATNDLAANLAGDDPMRAIGDLVAGFWARDNQATLIATLKGIFLAASMTGKVLDISALSGDDAVISADAFIDATQLMGDAKGELAAVCMHSAVEAVLAKQDLILYKQNSTMTDRIPYYLGKRVIVNDSCPVTNGVYTTYIFGLGAIALGNGSPAGFVATETERSALAGEDRLVNRRTLIMHPRGVKWVGTPAGASATNVELAVGTNWERVWEEKAVRMVAFKHRVAAAAAS